MADDKRDQTAEEYQPGTVDEGTHGWAPDAPGTGDAAERVNQANKRAREARDTQDEATGEARQGPDLTGGKVGESSTRRGEDIADEDGKETWEGPPKGVSQRPTGGFTDPDHVAGADIGNTDNTDE